MTSTPDHAFGIGCFHFGPQPSAPETLTWGQHFTNVETALRDVGAQDVSARYDDELERRRVREPGSSYSSIEDGEGVLPVSAFTRLAFRLPVPAAFQRTVSSSRPVHTTEYTVSISYGYYLPVAFIASETPTDSNPSGGVMVTREFLRDRLQSSNLASFECLGPSPFHADCYLEPREPRDANDQLLECERIRTRAYDVLRFSYDPSAQSATDAREALYDSLEDELSFYYNIFWSERRRYRAWVPIDQLVDDLVDLHSRNGTKAQIKRVATTPKLTGRAFIALARFETDALLEDRELQSSFAATHGAGDTFLKEQTAAEMADRFEFPIAQLSGLVGRFDQRRSGAAERAVLLLGPIIGVIAGALITILLT